MAVAIVLMVVPALAQREQALRVLPVVRGDQVLVSFELTDGVTEQLRAAIRSGLRTSFTYSVDLRLEVPAWVDRTIATATVTSSVEYDNLTRQHRVIRQVDGRVEDELVTGDEDVVHEWMTRLVRLPLFETQQLEPNREYYVRVTASARPSAGSFLWPFGSGASAQARFTFIR